MPRGSRHGLSCMKLHTIVERHVYLGQETKSAWWAALRTVSHLLAEIKNVEREKRDSEAAVSNHFVFLWLSR